MPSFQQISGSRNSASQRFPLVSAEIVDVPDKGGVEQRFRLDPEIVSGLAFAFGIGNQRCYQLQDVLFAMDIGER